MNVLVVNCGSSSIKLDVVDPASGERLAKARVTRVGEAHTDIDVAGETETVDGGLDHGAALERVLPKLRKAIGDASIEAVGHRVVHGGEAFSEPARVDDDVEATIESLIPLAPLHNPANLAGVRAARKLLPDVPHVAVFDTAFHATLPRRAKTYALPTDVAAEHGLRRYGFHGPSHLWVASRAADFMGEDIRNLRIITCHLGNGASVAAVEYGRSVDTSMGMTPLEGLVMGTRSGDVDPGILVELMRSGMDADAIDTLLNRKSGLAGVSGLGNDMRDIERAAGEGDENAQLAIHVFTHRLRKYIGGYAAVMGGVDAIVFTAGIGENSALIRHRAAQRLEFLGARLDEDRNRTAEVTRDEPVAELSASHSRVKILAVATDEAREIARETARLAAGGDAVETEMTIPIAISARHIHLSEEHVAILFGEGHELTPRKYLSQPGQFATEETLNLIGPKRRIDGVRIIGPTRKKTQVEISRTDEFWLGVDAPIRQSGDLDGTAGITIEGPKGTVTLEEGVICAWRHIHMTPADAERFGVKHEELVEIAVDTEGRDLIFGDVMIRVKPTYALEFQLDTDEANAAEITSGETGVLLPTGATARLRRKQVRL